MVVPALIYVAFNWGDSVALSGWAIPAATDIAFAVGILSLFGKRVPASLKLFLLTIAIIDDLGAIVIIALFYTSDLSTLALFLAIVSMIVLFLFNRSGVTNLSVYTLVGVLLWVFVLKSGVHATLAGVVLAFAIPMRGGNGRSPLHDLEHALQPWVAFAILPIFALANAGISLGEISFNTLLTPVPLGIITGLFVGKQLGVFGFSWLSIKLGWATLPAGTNWWHIYGVSVLCGVGFTMSLFITSLAFEHAGPQYVVADRLGILVGSLLSAVFGYIILHMASKR
jgi:NhaA family Na+:H+ antiporter